MLRHHRKTVAKQIQKQTAAATKITTVTIRKTGNLLAMTIVALSV